MTIELNSKFQQALSFLQNSESNLFITGRAGTGKSTLLSWFRTHTTKSVVVLAPTGVSALNIQGETIHSFFKFKPGVTLEDAHDVGMNFRNSRMLKKLEIIIIDEISMVRADLLDCVDNFLQAAMENNAPFGGKQMVFIGDLYQLPPVITRDEKYHYSLFYSSPYFFSAKVVKDPLFKMEYIELEKIYRQNDTHFIEILNAIRNNTINYQQIAELNQRLGSSEGLENDEGYIYLTTTNAGSDSINKQKLSKLETPLYEFTATVEGNFDLRSAPADITLQVRPGAQVMFLMNHPAGMWVNGTIGQVKDIVEDEIIVYTQEGNFVSVGRHQWTLYKYAFDEATAKLTQEAIGSFTQYPLKLAWAVTIHKSQGKTFEKVILDLERGTFAHGQLYVALSRCKTLAGITLKKPVKKGHVIMDRRVMYFLSSYQYKIAELEFPVDRKLELLRSAITDQKKIEITYLKISDEKSTRFITPSFVGQMKYNGCNYLGLEAFCHERNQKRVFRVDRILSIVGD